MWPRFGLFSACKIRHIVVRGTPVALDNARGLDQGGQVGRQVGDPLPVFAFFVVFHFLRDVFMSVGSNGESCIRCRFFRAQNNDAEGYCHRFPHTASRECYPGSYPISRTSADYWCGEFQAGPRAEAVPPPDRTSRSAKSSRASFIGLSFPRRMWSRFVPT